MDADKLADLIRRAQAREAAAFDALVECYSTRLYGYFYRLTGSRHAAEDLLQDLFVRVVRMIGRYQHDGRFEAWLFRIATNLVRDRVRRSQKAPAMLTGEADNDRLGDVAADAASTDPSRPMQVAEQTDRLQWALAQLSGPEKEVIMLRHFSEMSFKEISELMGIPLGTALARAHRGLGRLRRLMTEPTAEPRLRGTIVAGPAQAPPAPMV